MTRQRARSASWDLRVACALISLDVIDPFLSDLGFGIEDGTVARRRARKYLAIWDSQEPEAWLRSVRTHEGAQVADRIAELSDELAVRGPNHFSWISLMVELENQTPRRSGPRITSDKFAWLTKAATNYLAESKHLSERLDRLDYRLSAWDAQFLMENFYPADDDDDARFDPRSWLWALLDLRQWAQFQRLLRSNLSAQDIEELVAWGNGVQVSPWRLSLSLVDGERIDPDSHERKR